MARMIADDAKKFLGHHPYDGPENVGRADGYFDAECRRHWTPERWEEQLRLERLGKPSKELDEAVQALNALADTPTPKPQEGIWTLTAPDGRQWQGAHPMAVLVAEQRERVPANVALARIQREVYNAVKEGE